MNILNRKVVFITGGTKGLGKEIVKKLLPSGAIIVTCSREPNCFNDEIIVKYKNRIEIFKYDIKNIDDIKKLLNYTKKKYGRIDVYINNAAESLFDELEYLEDISIETNLRANLISPILVLKEVCSIMASNSSKSKGLCIIIGSNSINKQIKGNVLYSTEKLALKAFSEKYQKELIDKRIYISYVALGRINTDFSKRKAISNKYKIKVGEAAFTIISIIEYFYKFNSLFLPCIEIDTTYKFD